jgi:predicted HAD superfamily Cof-like phosphohydrolase
MGIEPTDLPKQLSILKEEIEEFEEADDIEKQLDALIDIVYVTMVIINLCDYPFYEAWEEIQRSNMSKERAPKGAGKFGGTVRKGATYVKPSLLDIIRKWRKNVDN